MRGLNYEFGPLARRAGLALLCLWVLLGLAHTTMSFIRKGFPPSRPPIVGTDLPAQQVKDVLLLHELAGLVDQKQLLVLLPATADSSKIVFYRYQLAYTHYPLRVYARQLRQSAAAEVADEAAVILPAGLRLPPGWIEVARRDSIALHVRATP